MLVNITQLHENQLCTLDNMIKDVGKVVSDFVRYGTAAASSYLDNMIESMQYVQKLLKLVWSKPKNQYLLTLFFLMMF